MKEPKNWIDLPSELHENVAKFIDFLTLNRLSLCSKTNNSLAKSIKINIDFLKISVTDSGFEVAIFEEKEAEPIEIFGKFMEGKFEFMRKSSKKSIIKNFEISDQTSILSIFNALFRKNVRIGILAFSIDIRKENKNTKSQEIAKIILKNVTGNSINPPQKSIFSGKNEFFKKVKKPAKNCEILVRNWSADISRSWADWKDMEGCKFYKVSRWTMDGIAHEHIRAGIQPVFYTLLMIYIQDPPKYSIWIPEYQEKNLDNKMKDFDGVFEKFGNYSVKKIPLRNSKKSCFLKFSKCGISMKIVDSDYLENENCDMEFLCAECMEKTRENEHFHEKIMEML